MDTPRIDPRVERSRAAVLEAARDTVREHGYRGLTIEEVSERSGVAKTTIYRHWSDRASLLEAVFESLAGAPEVPATADLRADITVAMHALAAALRTSTWACAMPSLIEAAERDEEFRPMARAFVERRRLPMRARIAAAVGEGHLPAGTDPDIVVAMLTGPLFYRRFITRQPVTTRVADAVLDAVLGGLIPGGPPNRPPGKPFG